MELRNIYHPIEKELTEADKTLRNSLKSSRYKSILDKSGYLLNGGGKKLRTVMVLLSAKATSQSKVNKNQLIKIASGVELIHMASLLHDDVIDHSQIRHNKPTINSKWGEDVAIALGDYLYSVAFELISGCGNSDIIRCISSATRSMCEGELIQVCERDNLDLLKQRYILIVKKKTAALFAASCEAGSLISDQKKYFQAALKNYGLNFGIAFQIIDDYLDLVGEEQTLGKSPGQDLLAGEITLPILNLWESVSRQERQELESLIRIRQDKEILEKIRIRLFDSGAVNKTKEAALNFINLAKEKMNVLSNSPYKESLLKLADFIFKRGFSDSIEYKK